MSKTELQSALERVKKLIDFGEKEIISWQQDIDNMKKMVRKAEEGQGRGACPFCGNKMVDLTNLFQKDYFIRHPSGGCSLEEYLSSGYQRFVPLSECQNCRAWEIERGGFTFEKVWDREDSLSKSSFPYQMLSNFPYIDRVIKSSPIYKIYFIYEVKSRYYTFDFSTDEIKIQFSISKPKPSNNSKEGYIYLIQADPQTGNGYYKIGRSKNLFDRIKTFQVKLPFEIQLVHQFEADDMIQAEAGLHRRYGHRRVNGEWFDLETAMVAEIMEIERFNNGKFQMV